MIDTKTLLQQINEIASGPLQNACAMPPQMYLSQEILDLENQHIFMQDWACVGRVVDIPDPGDYLTYKIGQQPVAVIRQKDGALKAISNVCLHRMMVLLQGSGNVRRVVCPYHAWTYGIDGGLMGAPQMQKRPGFKPRDHCLPEMKLCIWEGWIYVTLNPDPPDLETLLQPLHDVVSRYGMADYSPVVTEDYVWDTNWKLLTENFMESYHLPVAHRQTVGAWQPPDSIKFPVDSFAAFTYQTFTKEPDATYGLAHENNTRLEGAWRYTSVMPTVFPSHMFVLAPDHLWYLALQPEETGKVRARFGAAIAPEAHAALDDPEGFIRETVDFFDKVNSEDKFVVEGIYQGARAPLSKGGPLSWMEREIHDFIGYLDRRLNG